MPYLTRRDKTCSLCLQRVRVAAAYQLGERTFSCAAHAELNSDGASGLLSVP